MAAQRGQVAASVAALPSTRARYDFSGVGVSRGVGSSLACGSTQRTLTFMAQLASTSLGPATVSQNFRGPAPESR